ncbi:MAG TPA: fibronectin type III domain-containing protein, partial [Candidatus Lokiarchaeia archaeon]|nr:fibronectin type III domain-containing protein [Candidatus Lokiarchaeia archaeon]
AITGYNVYRSLTTGTETLLINLGVVLTYTNVGLTNGQIYYYEVTAVNAMAESARSTEANATPRTIPWAPILNTAAPGNSQVVLAWTAPASNGGSAITGYNVYQGTTPGNETLLASLGAVLTYTSTGLTNGQIYYYKVSAVNAAGEGARSTELSATPATVPSAPLSLTEILENVQAFLNWAAPASNGGSAITGYKVYMGTTSGGETLLANLGVVLNYTATGLTNGQIYYFQVSAVNAFGEGARSTEVSALLSPMPGAPQSFAATAGAGQVTLNWAAPVYNSGFPIIGYVIYRGTVSNGETLIVTLGVVLTYTNTGLVNGQIYYYKVAAMNSQGTGPNATEVCATPLTVPGAPTLNTAIAGAAQVTLTWTAPASNGGSPITGYNLYRGTSSGGEVLVVTGIVSSPYTNTGLTNGQIYYYEVAALNSQGVGAMSTEQSATPFTVPGAPTGLVATPGNAQVVLTWVAPASNGGSAIAGYNVYRSLTTSTETLLINLAVALTYTDSGLTNGQMYFYKVTAVNVAGTGPLSTEASTTPLAGGMPGSPTGFSVTPGNAQVVLTWLVPSSNGGSPITGYHLYQGTTSGGEFLLVTIGNITTYTNVGLTNGQIYYYEVAAVNSQGVGAMSMEQSATPFTVPGAPTGLAAAPGNSQVVLTWVAPASNGGSLIFNYQVFQGTTSGGETWLANASTGLNYTSVGLINGQTYYFKIVAINCAGSGAFSTEVSAIPIGSCTIPSEPQSVTANAGNMQIVLNWVAPSSNGGSLIMSYWIFRWNVSEIVSSVSIPGNETSYIDSGLTNGVTYYYKIAAINSIGFGPNSTIVSATPSNGSIQLYPALSILFSLHGNVFYNPIHLTINITYGDWPVRQAWCVVDNMTLYNLSRINGTSTWGIYGVDVNLIAGSHALVFFVKDTGNHTISQSMTITVIVVTTVSNNSTTIMVIVIIVLGMSVGVALPLSYSRYRQRINQKKQVTSKASTKAKQISGMVGELSQDLDKKAKLLKTSMPVASTIQPYLRAKVAQRCALHKGLIVGPSYECKHCGAWYCLGCAYQLLEIDEKCFNCGAPIDAGSVVAASQQDMHPGKRLGISTLIDPEIIDKVRDLALSDEVEQDVLRMLRDIPPEQRFRYLEDTFDEKVPDDEDPF